MSLLDFTPPTLDLRLEIGDDPLIRCTIWTDNTKTKLLDLTGFTNFAATIRSPADQTVSFSVDTTLQAQSIIIVGLDGDLLRPLPLAGCKWDLKADQPNAREITLLRGRVLFRIDATR